MNQAGFSLHSVFSFQFYSIMAIGWVNKQTIVKQKTVEPGQGGHVTVLKLKLKEKNYSGKRAFLFSFKGSIENAQFL